MTRKTPTPILDLATHAQRHVALEPLAEYWDVNVQTVRKWIREGALRGFRFGRATRVKTVDALAFELKGEIKSTPVSRST